MEWIKIESGNSNVPSGKLLVVRYEYKTYQYEAFEPLIIKQGWGVARFAPKFTDTDYSEDWEMEDLDEKDGKHYLPEGWYKDYEHNEMLILMHETVTHFMEIDISFFITKNA